MLLSERKISFRRNNLEQVFTPSSAAILTFVDRVDLDNQISKALLIPGMQLIVYGHSGSGKTTITQNVLRKNSRNFIVTNCILDTSVNEIILDAFDKLNPYFSSEKTSKITSKISSEIKASYAQIESVVKSELSAEYGEKQQRILPVQLTPQRLADFLGISEVVWIIEDFHKVNMHERQKLSQILKIFVDASNKYRSVKIIAIGAVGTAREVVNYDVELTNRVSEIHVPLMSKKELENIVIKGEKLLNIKFDHAIHTDIIKFSNSLAAICHHLCFSLCYNNNIKKTQFLSKEIRYTSLKEAVLDYLKQNSDSFKETLDRALKPRNGDHDNTKGILESFCKSTKEELTTGDIMHYGNNRRLYQANLDTYLQLLQTADYGELLRFDSNSGKYSFSNPFFKAYTIMQFSTEEQPSNSNIKRRMYIENYDEILRLLSIRISDISEIKVSTKVSRRNKKGKK